MRTIHIINIVTKRHISEYSDHHLHDALEDLSVNGFTAIDIKFDMDGDIVIFCMPII